jgi:UDP-3-O-[3-hydroxymyristoyl] glucosamine N-acyltransferase
MSGFIRSLLEPVSADALERRIPVKATIVGQRERRIHGIAPLDPGCDHALSFCDPGEGAAERIRLSNSSVVIAPRSAGAIPSSKQTVIVVDDPRAWFIQALAELLPPAQSPAEPEAGIHPRAEVHPDARISTTAAIAERVRIGPRTFVGPGAVIYADTIVGANCVIGPGAVIGWVGLAYHEDGHGAKHSFPHLGGVKTGDWVDIGANACVCRGILSDTRIGDNVKIGSLVYIGHGVVVEDNVWISASTSIAGHSHLGEASLIGIGTTIIDNVMTEPDVLIAAGSVVIRDARAGEKLAGVPARPVPALRRFGPTPR